MCAENFYNPTLGAESDSCVACETGKASIPGSRNCTISTWQVSNMLELFTKISNYDNSTYSDFSGDDIMGVGDIVTLDPSNYTCTGANDCATSSTTDSTEPTMIAIRNLFGVIKCSSNDASCVLNGQASRRCLYVEGTRFTTLIIRALTFKNGAGSVSGGGGILITDQGLVDVTLCVFHGNKNTVSGGPGGALSVREVGTSADLRGTVFYNNSLLSGDGNDIYNQGGNVMVRDDCPKEGVSIPGKNDNSKFTSVQHN